jgi:phage terminase small subunit
MGRTGSSKDEKFLAGKSLGGRPAVVEARITAPVKPHKPKVLTPQEWKFVEEFVSGDGHVTLKEAAIRAGYSEVWAKNRSRELTDPDKSPHIVAAIQERRRELGEKYATTFERHMRDLQVIRDQALAAGAYGAAVQAEYRRGQALGTIYIDRKEIRHGTIDSMSKEEVQRKLEEIKRLYGGNAGPIIDVTPKQIEEEPEEEEGPDGSETGSEPVQKAERKPPKLPYHPD